MLDIAVPMEENFRISPKSVCGLYLMLKLHFKGTYDVKKYNWKYSISDASFNARRDKKYFESIAYKYRLHELVKIFTNTLLSNNESWVGNMTTPTAIADYRKYDTMLTNYAREFNREMEIISLICNKRDMKFMDILKYDTRRKSSFIFKLLINGSIKFETFLILDRYFNLIDRYDASFDKDDFEWNQYSTILKAYRKILIIEDQRYAEILHEVLKNKMNININTDKLNKLAKINGEKI